MNTTITSSAIRAVASGLPLPKLLTATMLSLLPVQAGATTGPGCLQLRNVAANDVLNVRAKPSSRSAIVDILKPNAYGVIHLDGKCRPLSRKWAQRWCPITHYSGDRTTRGYVKARYVRDSECP